MDCYMSCERKALLVRQLPLRYKHVVHRPPLSMCVTVHLDTGPKMAAGHVNMDATTETIKVAVLGSPGVGKTSVIRQFVCNQFSDIYQPTVQKQYYYPAVMVNERLYQVRLLDCPCIPYFPTNTLCEWSEFRGYGLLSASAYVLVYDITSEDSFQYIKTLRDQIMEARDMHDVPMFVVGNKHDLSEDRGMPRREVANLVKKQWKCGYIECSAKHNWHIILLFKELMKAIDVLDHGHKTTSVRMQDAFRRNRCVIL